MNFSFQNDEILSFSNFDRQKKAEEIEDCAGQVPVRRLRARQVHKNKYRYCWTTNLRR